jgi:hypothetical protein
MCYMLCPPYSSWFDHPNNNPISKFKQISRKCLLISHTQLNTIFAGSWWDLQPPDPWVF